MADQKIQARKQLGLPEEPKVLMLAIQFQPEYIGALTPLLFSLSTLHTLHSPCFCLYLLSEDPVDTMSVTCIAQQSQALGIADYVFFNLNPLPGEHTAAIDAADALLYDSSDKGSTAVHWKTTSRGRALLEGLEDASYHETEKKLLSKSLLQQLLIQTLSGKSYKEISSLNKDPVIFYYTLFWLLKQNFIEQSASPPQSDNRLTPYSRAIIACYEQGQNFTVDKESMQSSIMHQHSDPLREPFIRPFINYLSQKLTPYLQTLTDVLTQAKILKDMLSVFINEIDARFLQALAIWQRDHIDQTLTQKEVIWTLKEKGGLIHLLQRYPNWARMTWQHIFISFHETIRLLTRLKKDLPSLQHHFFYNITAIKLHALNYLSDKQCQGPIKLTFTNKKSLVYKPRDLRAEMAVTGCTHRSSPAVCRSLAERFNKWNNKTILHPLSFLCRTDNHKHYGYAEYIQASLLPTKKEQAFLLGELSTFALISGMADLHSDNVCHYQGKLAILDCKYLFSPVILQKLQTELLDQKSFVWENSSLAATHMSSLWEHQLRYTLSVNTAFIEKNHTIAFKGKKACLAALQSNTLFTLTNSMLPNIKAAFNKSWLRTCYNKQQLLQWLNDNSLISVCQLPLTPSKSTLYQHTLTNCDAFYCHTQKQLITETRQRINKLMKHSPVSNNINPSTLAMQWIQQKTTSSYSGVNIEKWKKLLLMRFNHNAHSQLSVLYITQLKK